MLPLEYYCNWANYTIWQNSNVLVKHHIVTVRSVFQLVVSSWVWNSLTTEWILCNLFPSTLTVGKCQTVVVVHHLERIIMKQRGRVNKVSECTNDHAGLYALNTLYCTTCNGVQSSSVYSCSFSWCYWSVLFLECFPVQKQAVPAQRSFCLILVSITLCSK